MVSWITPGCLKNWGATRALVGKAKARRKGGLCCFKQNRPADSDRKAVCKTNLLGRSGWTSRSWTRTTHEATFGIFPRFQITNFDLFLSHFLYSSFLFWVVCCVSVAPN